MNSTTNRSATARTRAACAALAFAAGLADAQVLNGGFDHDPVGAALLSATGGRKVRALGIGSSGQDGVEVQLRSASGGQIGFSGPPASGVSFASVAVPLLGTPIEFRHTIETRAGGTAAVTFDFSDLPPSSITVEIYDGPVLVNTYTEPGPILFVPEVPDNYCPDGSPAIPYWRWVTLCNSCSPVWVVGWTCANGDVYSYNDGTARVVVTPNYPVGTFPNLPFGNARVTSSAGPEIEVHAPALATFGLESWGLRNARLSEECDGPAPCGPDDSIVRASHLDSSGQDGVALSFGPNAAGGQISVERNVNGWDVKEIKKFYDDSNQEVLRVSHNPPTTPDADVQLQFDFFTGSGDVLVELFDGGGNPLDSFTVVNTGTVVLDPAWLCPPPQYPVYAFNFVTQQWIFLTCAGGFDMVTPSGTPVSGVEKVTFTALGDSTRRLGRVEVTGSDSQGDIFITDADAFPCPSDVTGDGTVDLLDFFEFFACYDQELPCADIDGNPGVDLGDFFTFFAGYDSGC